MKRIISVLLSVALILSLATVSFAADDATITVASVTAEDGVANVTISLSNNPGITSMLLSVTYDSALTLTGVTDAGQLGTPFHSTEADDLNKNPYTLLWNDFFAKDDYKVNGAIVTLKFEVKDGTKPGDYTISVSYEEDDVANCDGDNVSFAVVNGKVTVKGTAEPACEHTNKQKVDAKEATCVPGNSAYWYCTDCDKFFSDAAGNNEIEENSWILTPTMAHDFSDIVSETGEAGDSNPTHQVKCSRCGTIQTPETSHAGAGDYINDTTKGQHYQECGCGVKVYSAHVYDQQNTDSEYSAAAATCTTPATYYKSCICGAMGPESMTFTFGDLAATNHTNVVTDAAVPATCTATGLTAGSHCEDCKTVIVAQTVTDKAAHNFGEWTVVTPATETTPGSEKRVCQNPGCSETETREIPVLTHTHSLTKTDAKAATCTEDGNNDYWTCASCKKVFKADKTTETTVAAETIKAKGHTEVVDEAVAPTCTETGLTEGKHCSVCNTVIVAQTVTDKAAHNFGEWTVVTLATETTPGSEKRECQNCDAFETREIPVLTHTHAYGDEISERAATCTEAGTKAHYECSCGRFFTKDATGNYVEATADDLLIPPAHTPVTDAAVPATCTTAGKTEGSHCDACKAVIVAQQPVDIDPNAHTDVKTDEAVPATCTEPGLTEGSHCEACRATIRAQETITAIGHKWNDGEVTKEPTCDKDGVMTYTCQRDSSHTKTETIPATGKHNYGRDGKCTECGARKPGGTTPVTPTTPTTPSTGKDAKSPTTGDAGIMLYAGMSVMSLMGMGWVAKKRHD